MKKLDELIYNQMQIAKFMKEAKTRSERYFYKESINEIEEEIEKIRKEMGLK